MDASSEEDMSEDEDEAGWSETVQESVAPVIAQDISLPIKKVSKIINKFRKSPKLWERLLDRTQIELPEHERLGLLSHSKTRYKMSGHL